MGLCVSGAYASSYFIRDRCWAAPFGMVNGAYMGYIWLYTIKSYDITLRALLGSPSVA